MLPLQLVKHVLVSRSFRSQLLLDIKEAAILSIDVLSLICSLVRNDLIILYDFVLVRDDLLYQPSEVLHFVLAEQGILHDCFEVIESLDLLVVTINLDYGSDRVRLESILECTHFNHLQAEGLPSFSSVS